MDLFRLCPPQYVMHPPVIEHVSLHSKPLYKNMAASGGVNNMHPLSWGGGGGGHKQKRSKDLENYMVLKCYM